MPVCVSDAYQVRRSCLILPYSGDSQPYNLLIARVISEKSCRPISVILSGVGPSLRTAGFPS